MPADPDDIFEDSRMSFGDHLDELRTRLWAAVKGLAFCMAIGLILDAVGSYAGYPNFGIGKPVFNMMTATVENQVRDFQHKRTVNTFKPLMNHERISEADADRIVGILEENEYSLESLSSSDREKLLGKPEPMRMIVPTAQLEPLYGSPKNPNARELELTVLVYPAEINFLSLRGEVLAKSKKYLTSLSVQEPFMVYFKVSLICGLVLASPWIFYQIWAFVAAGLYPHERRYVHVYLPFSIGLFLAGVIVCQLLVLPGAVSALLSFNSYLDVDPDIRLNEWLSFALILPLVFGVSFQTPLVMMFLNRIGMFGYQDYMAHWRGAVMTLAIFAAVITPTPDVVTMMYLFVPMMSLYILGILICKYFPPSHEQYLEAAEAEQVAV